MSSCRRAIVVVVFYLGDSKMDITRRNALKIISATPVAAGIGLTDVSADTEAHQHPRRPSRPRPPGRAPYKPKFFNAHEWATVAAACQHHHPEGRAVGQRHRRRCARVHRLHDDRPARRPGADAWRLAMARCRVQHAFRQDGFVEVTDEQRIALLDDIAYPRKAQPGVQPRRRLFLAVPRCRGHGLFHEQGGHRRLAVHGQCAESSVGRLPRHLLHPPRGDQGVTARAGRAGRAVLSACVVALLASPAAAQGQVHAGAREPEGARVVPGRQVRALRPLGRLQRPGRRRVGDEQREDPGRRLREAAGALQPRSSSTPPSGWRRPRPPG